MKLGEFLKKEKITVAQLSKYLDVHAQTLYSLIKGRRYPSYMLAKAISEFTNGEVTVDEVMGDKPQPKKCPCCGRIIPRNLILRAPLKDVPENHKEKK